MNINFSDLNIPAENLGFEIGDENFNLELTGTFKLSKGSFVQEFTYWARIYDHNIKGYLTIDEFEISHRKTNIGDLAIDDVNAFKEMLVKGGLKSLSDKLTFTDEQKNQCVYRAMENHHVFKSLYGPGMRLFDALPKEEQYRIKLKWVIDTYNERNDYQKKEFSLIGDVPSIEELKELYYSLK